MTRLLPRVCAVCWVLLPSLALAQADLPRGPADIIGGSRRARDARDMKRAGERAAQSDAVGNAPPPASDPAARAPANAGAPGQARQDAAGASARGDTGEAPHAARIASERADESLPAGTIRVRVLDPGGSAAAAADVELAIMASDNTRTTRSAKTAADGRVAFGGLASGDRQAYRVNVPYEGAKYSSNPFRLPVKGGYEVEINRLPVTHDARMVVTFVGATSIELKDDRLKIVQQTRLMNVGHATYVFPEAGTLVGLPKGFMAVQTQDAMTDQKVVEAKGQGLRVHGSLPPGEATLLWAFDLPLSGTEADFGIDLPWLVFTYRVIADAPAGMSLQVADMPESWLHTDKGRRFWVTETQRRAGDQPFRRVQIKLKGMPGQGVARWFAVALALGVLIAGAAVSLRKRGSAVVRAGRDFEAHKAELLQRARAVQSQHQAGETGPEYYHEQIGALTEELAELLFEQAELKKRDAPAARS